jgi:hypothetical protein
LARATLVSKTVRRVCFSAKVRFPSQEFDFDFHNFTHDTTAVTRPAELVVASFNHTRRQITVT